MVNIETIAKLSNCSVSTVSKALNGYKDVSPKTRQKIMEIAQEMGYVPNATARSLVSRRSYTIGVVYEVDFGFRNSFFPSVLESLRRNVEKKGYDILLLSYNNEDSHDYLRHCISRNVDAILVVYGRSKKESISRLYQSEYPVLTLDPHLSMKNSIQSNNYESIRKACKYLYELGHRKIAFIPGDTGSFIGQQRLQGYLDFVQEFELEPFWKSNLCNVTYTVEDGYQSMRQLFEAFGLPDAVCSAGDLLSMGAIQYLKSNGFSVPEDVSVIGFDDLVVGEFFTPALTTVHQDYHTIGKLAADVLIEMIETGSHEIDPISVDTWIVVRDSCRRRR